VIAGLALDAIVVTTIMGRRVGRNSKWSMGASFGAFVCSALIAVDSYSTWLEAFRPLLHVSYPAMVFLYSQHLATTINMHAPARAVKAIATESESASIPLSKTAQVKALALSENISESTAWRRMKAAELSTNGKEQS